MDRTKCLLCSASEKDFGRIKEGKFKWVYFGEDASELKRIEERFGSENRIETGRLLKETVKELREKYIDYIGELGLENNSPEWWACLLSEKVLYISKTFFYCCYMKMFFKIVQKYSGKIIFFVENRTLRRTIAENAWKKGIEAEDIVPENKLIENIKNIKDFLANRIIFALNNMHQILISRYFFRMQNQIDKSKPMVLIHTFLTGRSFSEKEIKESYFGELPKKLREMGLYTARMPSIWGTNYYKAVKKMKESGEIFLVPHAFLGITDVFRVLLKGMKKSWKKNYPDFDGMDIGELIKYDLKNEWTGRRYSSNWLFYYLIKRLKENNVKIENIMYIFENQTWEKIFLNALQEFYPSAYASGYQHSNFSKMHLNYFFSEKEKDIVPLPDRIVTNGEFYKERMMNTGYPKNAIVKGGAIRYAGLENVKEKERKLKGKPKILVTSSIGEFETKELLWKVFKAFGNNERYKVMIKCHPYMPFENVSKSLRLKLPGNFTIEKRNVPELLEETDVLIYSSSTTSIEAIARGIPIVHLSSELSPDLDILDFEEKAKFDAMSAEELQKGVEKALGMSEKEYKEKKKRWKEIVSQLFGKVTDESYSLFVGKK